MSPTLLALNAAFIVLLPIAYLLYRSGRRAEADAPRAAPRVVALSPAVEQSGPFGAPAALAATLSDDKASVALMATTMDEPTDGAPTEPAGSRRDSPDEAGVMLMAESAGTDQGWIVTRFVHELAAAGFQTRLAAPHETVVSRGHTLIRVTQLPAEDDGSPDQVLITTQRAHADVALEALLHSLIMLQFKIRWTVDTEVMLTKAGGEVVRVRLAPAPAIAIPSMGSASATSTAAPDIADPREIDHPRDIGDQRDIDHPARQGNPA